MRISEVRVVEQNGMARLQGEVIYEQGDKARLPLWIEVPAERRGMLNAASHAFLVASLLPTMRRGEDIIYEGPVDDRARWGLGELQRAFCCMFPKMVQPVSIDFRNPAPNRSGPRRPGRAVFFSAGIDAFHCAYRVHHEPLLLPPQATGYLLPVHGFDVPPDQPELFQQILRAAEVVRRRTGWLVVPVRTNIKQAFFPPPRHVGWNELGFSPMLASIGHALSNELGKIHIASGACYHQFELDASGCRTDPFWSSSHLEVINLGTDKTRLGKIIEMADWAGLLGHMRSCLGVSVIDPPNCGLCKKCVRTIIALYAAGVLPKAAPAFPGNVDEQIVEIAAKAWSRSHLDLDLFHEVVEHLDRHPVDHRSAQVARNLRQGLKSMDSTPLKKFLREWDKTYLKGRLDHLQTRLKNLHNSAY